MTPFAQQFLRELLKEHDRPSHDSPVGSDLEKLSLAERCRGAMMACGITGDVQSIVDLSAISAIALVTGYDGLVAYAKEEVSHDRD